MRKHPIVEFFKYVLLLVIIMSTMHLEVILPIFIFVTVVTKGRLWLMDLWILTGVVFIDAFSSIDGVTYIAYHNYHIITLEAICYGFCSGLRLITILGLCWKFSNDVRSEKLVIVTSFLAPPLALLISMTVRNIRRYTLKLKEIYSLHLSMSEKKNFIAKLLISFKSLSILIDWALENGMETVFSMENRHYGKYHRTSYKPVSLVLSDIIEVLIYALFTVVCIKTIPEFSIVPEINLHFSILNIFIVLLIVAYCFKEEYYESKVRKDDL